MRKEIDELKRRIEEKKKKTGYIKNGRSNQGCAPFHSLPNPLSPAPTAPGDQPCLQRAQQGEAVSLEEEGDITERRPCRVALASKLCSAATRFLERELGHAATYLSPHKLIIDIQRSGRKG